MTHERSHPLFGRRQLLAGAGTLGLGALARPASAAPRPALRGAFDELSVAEIESLLAGSCQASPSMTEGPFYLDLGLLRKDITVGEPGIPLKLLFRVVRASTCDPIEDAVVDLWCCNSQGEYSGIPSRGTTGLDFLRGYQLTGPDGMVRFHSIYPGWYPGRTPHLHVKIYPTPSQEFTTQTFFEDALSDEVYTLPPYDAHGPATTHNGNDFSFDPDNLMEVLRTRDLTDGIFAGITIVVP